MATIKPGTYTRDELLRALLPERVYNCLETENGLSFGPKKPELTPYAWPGGYDIGYLDADNCILCAECATKQIVSQLEEVAECIADGREYSDRSDSFRIVAVSCAADWEGNELCEVCGKSLGPECEEDTEG
jgi:hypothetical protein